MTTAPARRKDVGAAPATTAAGAALSGGAFAAKHHEPATVTLDEPAPFTDMPAGLPADVRELAEALAAVYRDTSNRRAPWIADETFTCDGGAVAAKLTADRLGIDATLHVGLYWHSDVVLRAEEMGETREPGHTDEEWAAVLADVEQWMDEHHHWVTVRASDGEEYLIDPNGPHRREPHVMTLRDAGDRYEDGAEPLVYDPDDDPNRIADAIYPGLREQVESAVAVDG